MSGPTPRIPRDEVRRRLLDAAARIFAERGYAAARLDEIAYAAGFTKGAVYSNFASKHTLLAELIGDRAHSQLATGAGEIKARASEGRESEGLTDIAEAFALSIVEDGTWSRLLVEIAQQSARDPEVRDTYAGVRRTMRAELAEALAEGCAQRGIELSVPVEQAALTLQVLRLGLILEHSTDPDNVDRDAIVAVVTDTLRGLIHRPAHALEGARTAH